MSSTRRRHTSPNDFASRSFVEKGGYTHSYSISKEGLQAIRDYVENERPSDAEHWRSPALFLTACKNARSGESLSVRSVNVI